MLNHMLKSFLIIFAAIIFVGCAAQASPELVAVFEKGEVVAVEDVYGTYFVYAPTTMPAKPDLLVLIHGTPSKALTAEETAVYYVDVWRDFAEEEGIVLLAPSFNHEDFSSRKGELTDKMTGYRGLFGREIGADEWVLRIVDAYQQAFGEANEKFLLYGHSAGGQFVGRFLVTHPERVKRAVITAALTYPQPNSYVAWPYGMGELHTEIEWDAHTVRQEDVIPDLQKWLEATQIPVTVLVGQNDVSKQLQRPGQKGTNRLVIGKNWVDDMKALAVDYDLECDYKFSTIPGKGHSMYGLVEFSQEAIISK